MAQLQTTAVTGSLTVTGQIIAQTLNVQQVTSSIIYSSGSNRFGNLTSDVQQFTGSLRVTGSGDHYIVGGNIGIGTTTPVAVLHSLGSGLVNVVQSSNTVSYTQYYNTSTGTNSTNDGLTVGNNGTTAYIYNREAVALIFCTSNLDRGRFTAGGTFLVGDTVTPSETAWFGTAAFGKNATNKVILGYLGSSTNGAVIGGHNSALNAWADLNINGINLIFRSAEVEYMRMNTSGNLGIGTTAPIAKLQVAGTSGNLLTVGTLTNNWAGEVAIGVTNGNGVIISKVNTANDTNRVIILYRDDTNGATIWGYKPGGGSSDIGFQIRANSTSYFNGGNVGINTTVPTARLQVSGSSDVLNVKGSGSLSTSSLFSVDGAYGRLFEVTDDLSNSLFSVNTIAGLPVIEAFADYSVNLGTYSAASGSTMRVTGSRVGIGTTTPGTTLDVLGNVRAQSFTGSFSGSSAAPGASNNVIYNSSGVLAGSNSFVFNGTNVGIGTTSPNEKLVIQGNSAKIKIQTAGDPASYYTQIESNYDASNTFNIIDGGSYKFGSKALIAFNDTYINSFYNVYIATGTVTNNNISNIRLFVTQTGNIGIGTTSPNSTLQVSKGGVNFQVTDTNKTANNTLSIYALSQTSFAIATGNSGSFSGSEKIVLLDNGNVGIGLTAPDAKLTVSASSGDLATFYTGTTKRLTITTGGNLSFSTSTSLGLIWSPASLLFEGQTQGITARPYAANYVSFTVAGAVSQTANLQTWQAQGGTVYSVVDAAGDFAIQATASIGKLQLGSDWTANPGGGNQVYLSNAGFINSAVIPEAIITTNNASTTPGGTIGLALHNNNVTAGAFSPLLVFSKRETGSTPYNASIAAIGARTVTGTGAGDGWIDGDLMFYTAPTAGSGLVERMRIIQDGNVGIGTSAPAYKLDVNGTARFSGVLTGDTDILTRTKFQISNGRLFELIGSSTALNIYDASAGTSRIYLTDGGNVGIGTTVPAAKLDVVGTSGWTGVYASSGARFVAIASDSAAQNDINWDSSSDLRFSTATNKAVGGYSEKMRITSGGNVGIGTTVPSVKLHVIGDTILQSTSTGNGTTAIRVNNSSGTQVLAIGAAGGIIMNNSAKISTIVDPTSIQPQLELYNAGTGYTTLQSSTSYGLLLNPSGGNVGIGASAPTNTLQVVGGVTALSFTGSLQGTASYATQALSASYAPGGGGSQWTTTGNNIYYTTGNVGIGTSTIGRKLDVYGDGTVARLQSPTANQFVELEFSASGVGPAYIFKNSSGYAPYGGGGSLNIYNTGNIGFHSDSTFSIMTLLGTGNVGIGSTAPTQKLDVAGSIRTTANIFLPSDGMIDFGSGDARIVEGEVSNYSLSFKLYDPLTTTVPVRLFMSASGNVGIGTTSPTRTLDVRGGVNIQSSGSILLLVTGSQGELLRVQDSGSSPGILAVISSATTNVATFTTSSVIISGSLLVNGSTHGIAEHMILAVSDETTNITTGTAKITFRAPFAMTLTQIPRASLSTASTSGLVTVDINEAGTSILGVNKLSIDANELTSTTAATPTTLADTSIADDAQITVDIDGAGTGARGLKVTLYYVKV